MAGRGLVCLLTLIALTLLRGTVFASKEDVVFSGSSSVVSEAINEFNLFKKLFSWSYKPGTDEYYRRIINVEKSLLRCASLNNHNASDSSSAKYGINQFSVLSPEEFRDRYLTTFPEKVPEYPASETARGASAKLPTKFDWREKNVVTPVENQESCGGCWAFSVVGIIESVYALQGHPLRQLSVQQVIDCSYKNQGCNGGSTVRTLSWLKQTQEKLVRQAEYPFKAETGVCRIFPLSEFGVSVKDFAAYDFSGNEEVMMQKLLEWGPLAVTVDAVSWQDYLGGIIQHHCPSQRANHAVLITGYDATGEVPYWIVRNSWGTSWGNQGYVYIKMGGNVCGVADAVAAVFV
ncbi:cathepsin O [Brienomyrus brachyistius]|uniref:cathepsin O n=1 Tax=Brienomyrus brachyistius TaxID=42636 RepID=UPI0020B1A5AA|nr:cathepsin O [Brienomyrus brachyistius]